MISLALYVLAGVLTVVAGAMVHPALGVAVAAVACAVAGYLMGEVSTDAPD